MFGVGLDIFNLLSAQRLPQEPLAVTHSPASLRCAASLCSFSLLNKARRQKQEKTFVMSHVGPEKLHTPSRPAACFIFLVFLAEWKIFCGGE